MVNIVNFEAEPERDEPRTLNGLARLVKAEWPQAQVAVRRDAMGGYVSVYVPVRGQLQVFVVTNEAGMEKIRQAMMWSAPGRRDTVDHIF